MHEGESALARAFVAIGGLVVFALLAVLIAPHFIDWSAYRADFEREASRILGLPVAVHGTASVQVLPFPSVTFTDVEVGGENRDPLLTVASFRMDAELAPYLSGEIRIFSMRFDRPVLHLRLDRDGRANLPAKGGALPTDAVVVLEDVSVADGEIVVDDARSNGRFVLADVAGTFAASSLSGPFTGQGSLLAHGRPFGFQIAAGTPNAEVRLPLKVSVEDRSLSISASVDGLVGLENGHPRFEGGVRSASIPRPVDPTGTKDALQPRLQAEVPTFSLVGKAVAEPGHVGIDDIRLTVGVGEKPYVLTGSAELNGGQAPDFLLDLEGEQLDIDSLAANGAPRGPATFAQRLEAARALLASVPRPQVAGRARLSLPVVVAGDTTLRDLSVEASPLPSGWSIRRSAVELPGRTRLEASGILDIAASPAFRGSLLLAARQPSGFSEWLTGAVDPAVRSLTQAGFSATVDLSRERQVFRDLEVDVGGDTLKGSLQRSEAASGSRLDADLHGGRIDLDAFVALSRIFTGEADSLAEAREGRLQLVAGPVSYLRTAADRVDADISFDGTTLTIDHASITGLAGANLSAKGALSGLGGDPAGRIDVTFAAERAEAFLDLLATRVSPSMALDALRAHGTSISPLMLSGTLHTTPGGPGERPTLNIDMKGSAAATEAALTMRLANGIYARGTTGGFDVNLGLRSDEPAGLLAQLGIDALPLPLPSPMAVDVTLAAEAAAPVATHLSLTAPGSRWVAEGTVDLAASGLRKMQLGLSGRSEDITPWLLATGAAFGADPTASLPATIGGDLQYDGDVLSLSAVEGSLGPIDLSAELERRGEGPLSGRMFLSELSVPWLASLVYGQPALDPTHPENWNGSGFGRPLLPDMALSLDVTADQLRLGHSAALGDASVHLVSSADELTLEDMRGTFGGGYGTGTLRFQNVNGVGAFAAEADLQGLDLGGIALKGFALPTEEDVATEDTAPPAISGTMDTKLRLDSSGQSYAALASAATGTGDVTVEDAAFAGIGTGMFAQILRQADAAKANLQAPAVAAILDAIDRDARYPLGAASTKFTVAGGVARFPATRIARPGETLTAEGAIDLTRFSVAASLRLDLDPGDEAVEGAAPSITYELTGPLAAPTLSPDVRALANYLSVRSLEREQARVEAIQSALQEKLRLRREARFYRWREARQTEERLEDIRSENLRRTEALEADRRKRADEEKAVVAARERARVERERAEAAKRDAVPPVRNDLDLNLDVPVVPPPRPQGSTDLPGVRQPQPF